MSHHSGEHVDLTIGGEPATSEHPTGVGRRRPWVGIRFDCCGIYVRVYRSLDEQWYRGRCPKCLREARLRVGPGGTSSRFFIAE
jgi:hypothetical protein